MGKETGIEVLGKQLVNTRSGPVQFDRPAMDLGTLLHYGNLLVKEQDNVKRVQLADAYLDGAELAGADGSRKLKERVLRVQHLHTSPVHLPIHLPVRVPAFGRLNAAYPFC